ncbi:MAG: hypothetical protein H2172_18485 [Opitutus sp.]|nr:hypothetical protein [Opitutus sp.]MCS6274844.1 hypothetical protein [Opitutus sp.]MCS6278399.1 hypothetical protein [Opitutus sp.]MCS6299509.1 hypothetical protein [Opitutus sp.]
MNQKIKLLLLALSLGLSAVTVQATCGDECDGPNPPESCNNDDDNNNGDSMPEGVIVDDMPTSVFAKD